MKDLFDTAGLETTYGSAVFAGHVPTETAEAVRLLEAAGYANVGKANLHEFAYGTTSENPHYGDVPNPRFPGRVAGGSSGGSAAAVAAGLADAALGTDSAGSIRIPAACCGVVGQKPTYGLVPLEGCWPLAASFDTAGPLAGDVEGCERMLGGLVPGFGRPSSSRSRSSRSASPGPGSRIHSSRARRGGGRALPARRAVELPLVLNETYAVFMREVADVHRELFAEKATSTARTSGSRSSAVSPCATPRSSARSGCEPSTGNRWSRTGRSRPRADPDAADRRAAAEPGGTGDLDVREQLIRFTYPFSALGWPALALPCGPAEEGLPASLQIAGRAGADALVLAAGVLVEA